MRRDAKQFLTRLFQAAIDAARPALCVPPHLPAPPKGRTIVIGAGKAAASMAAAVEAHWPGPLKGLVVTRYGHGAPTTRIEVVEAAHPVPDEAGMRAATRILDLVKGLTADDLVICLVSGGGSALLAAPAPGLTLVDKQALNRALLRSGADITEMNCVRKHLSAIKGGRLARAIAPARLVTLIISDVPGDDPAVIASGPTVPDSTTLADARMVLAKYGIAVPPHVQSVLEDPASETPKAGEPCFAGTEVRVISRPQDALLAAADVARAAGVTPVLLGDAIEGESREVGRVMAGIARSCVAHSHPAPGPCVLLSGGETSVTVRGQGRGGRNAEFLLALAVALNGDPRVAALAGDTDGIDGSEDNAGAFVGPESLGRAAALGVHAKALLADNDGYTFFAALDDLVMTGPTLTNVNDFRAILVEPD
ncbi:glycerate kinase type-2 family protein [Lichenifustis flavocetrariae]|uniref:Glycerate kinase n=1 Tax=Lichenifustis flavocetrariae TaxID=2949735 RepID=A0AA41Z7T1_9HYPH|nr:glycerate kinase [Lichenifustis flavocetrariae]MCW6510842.1 glycerate kinase [Lichenifustis flavocetrariae]